MICYSLRYETAPVGWFSGEKTIFRNISLQVVFIFPTCMYECTMPIFAVLIAGPL